MQQTEPNLILVWSFFIGLGGTASIWYGKCWRTVKNSMLCFLLKKVQNLVLKRSFTWKYDGRQPWKFGIKLTFLVLTWSAFKREFWNYAIVISKERPKLLGIEKQKVQRLRHFFIQWICSEGCTFHPNKYKIIAFLGQSWTTELD